MKPYLVHKTWIDLDHVLAIKSDFTICNVPAAYPEMLPYVVGSAEMMFRDKPVDFFLGYILPGDPEGNETARPRLDAFIAAWKAKDIEPNAGGGGDPR